MQTKSGELMVKSEHRERGAVAVELAFLLPLLLLILLGMIEYGRVFNVQVSLTHAAREGARHGAIHYKDADFDPDNDVRDVALAAAPALGTLPVNVDDDAASCAPGGTVTVTASISLESLSGFLESGFYPDLLPGLFPMDLAGIGVMRCGG